jgi:peptidoglycan/LPS O-acetylase OafA/YrhL
MFPSRWTHPAILLDVFSVGVALWLGFEIVHFRQTRPLRVLEWAGRWSFSLYLVHTLIPHWGVRPHWLPFAYAFFWSYVFYLLVERPSHWSALVVGRRISREDRGAGAVRVSPRYFSGKV